MKIAISISNYSRHAGHFMQLCCFCLVALIPLAACSQMKTITWREQVKLSDGQIIVVERTATFRNVYAGGTGNGWLFQRERIKAVLPPLNKEVVWEGGLEPLAIDVAKNGEIYLVAIAETSQGQEEYSIGDTRHAAFKFSGSGQWIRTPVESVPHEIHPNLLIDRVTLFIDHGYS